MQVEKQNTEEEVAALPPTDGFTYLPGEDASALEGGYAPESAFDAAGGVAVEMMDNQAFGGGY